MNALTLERCRFVNSVIGSDTLPLYTMACEHFMHTFLKTWRYTTLNTRARHNIQPMA